MYADCKWALRGKGLGDKTRAWFGPTEMVNRKSEKNGRKGKSEEVSFYAKIFTPF
jgi:hypothetical protein